MTGGASRQPSAVSYQRLARADESAFSARDAANPAPLCYLRSGICC